jgi:hypothetical protein
MEVGLGGNTEKIKYVVVSRHENAGKYHNLLTANKSLENVAVKTFWNGRNKS